MALPTYEEQLSMEFLIAGEPFMAITGNSNIVATTMEFLINTEPYYATSPSGAPPVTYNAAQFFMLF